MFSLRRVQIAVVWTVVGIGSSSVAVADPILQPCQPFVGSCRQVTGGSIAWNQSHIRFSFLGDDFDIAGGMNQVFTPARHFPARSGESFGVSIGASSLDIRDTRRTQVVDAQTFSPVFLGGFIDAGTTLPLVVPGPDSPLLTVLTEPFRLTPGSFLEGFSRSPLDPGDPFFRFGIWGSGHAEITLAHSAGSDLFQVRGAVFEFGGAAPTPTPEPGTLLLLGTSLIAAGGVYRRRTHEPSARQETRS